MAKSITSSVYVGLDVHKDSIDIAVAEAGREDAVRECGNARHRLKALLLRNGITYAGRMAWTAPHLRWLATLKMQHSAQQIGFQENLHAITEATAVQQRRSMNFNARVRAHAVVPPGVIRLDRRNCLGLLALAPWAALAQTAPSPGEVAGLLPLHAAAHRGDLAALRRALQQGADVNGRDGHGRTALHVAAFARQREAIRTLAAAGANLGLLENDRYDAVTIAAVADDVDTLRVLLALGASARLTTSRYDGTALIAAAHLGHDGVVRQLVAAGAPLDHVNNLHWTATLEAVVLGDGGPRHQATLKALIEAGANLQLTDRSGRTPLALARERGYAAMAQMLLKAGAR